MEDGSGEPQPDDEDMEEATGLPDVTAACRGGLLRKSRGTEEYPGVTMVRVQHCRNLVAIMRQAMLTSDYETAAGALGTLLGCMPEGTHINKFVELSPGSVQLRDSLLEVSWNMLEVMRQYEVTHEQFKRYLKKVTSLLRMEQTMRQVGKLEIIMAHWTQDSAELRTCLDLIRDELGRKHLQAVALPSARNFSFYLSAFQAYIRHSLWMEQTLSSLSDLTSSQHSSQSSTPINNVDASSCATHDQISQDLLGPLQLGPFVPQDDIITLLQSQAGQQSTQESQAFTQPSQGFSQPPSVPMTQQSQVQGAGQSSEGAAQGTALSGDGDWESLTRSLQRALEMIPAALLPALLLCHTLVISDNQEDAAAVAQAAVDASGRSSEALSLLAVVKEAVAVQSAENGSSTQLEHDSTDAPAVAAAAGNSGAVGSENGTTRDHELTAAGHADDISIHQFVELCLEILQSDPWQLGAVQGLIQMCSHCHRCAAAAVQGILAHLDAAALGTTAAAGGGGRWSAAATADETEAETAAATLWSVLSVLLVQLATAVAVDAAQQAAAVAQPAAAPRAAAAAVVRSQHEPMDVDTQEPASTATAATAGGHDANPCAGPTAVQLIWEDLQDSFIGRRCWWLGAGSVADITELDVLRPQQQQEEEEQGLQEGDECDESNEQQQQGKEEVASQHPDAEAAEGLDQPTEQQVGQKISDSEQDELILLRGADSDTDREDECAKPGLQQEHSRDTAAAAEPAGQVDNADVEDQDVALQAEGSGCWADVKQTLCCKAIALVFVVGSQNNFSHEAADALEAAASAAGDSGSGNGEHQDPGDLSVVAARAALQDAFQLGQQTDLWLNLRQQQKLQKLVQQQLQQQAGTTRLLGTPNEMFGGMLDMPDSWWTCFPHKRRRRQQQQQQEES